MNSEIDDVDVEEGALRHCHLKVGSCDRWKSSSTIAVPGDDGRDSRSIPGYDETGNALIAGELRAKTSTNAGSIHSPTAGSIHSPTAVGFFRVRESPRTVTIESLALGSSGAMEPRLVGFPAAGRRDDAGNQPCEPEAGDGKDGRWGESGRRTRPSANAASVNPVAGDGGGSNSLSQRAGSVRNDRIEGV